MARNSARDFCPTPDRGIRMEELTHYAQWLGLQPEEKKALLDALTTHLGARIETRDFWTEHGPRTARFLMGVYWNSHDDGPADLAELFARDRELFCTYAPLLN